MKYLKNLKPVRKYRIRKKGIGRYILETKDSFFAPWKLYKTFRHVSECYDEMYFELFKEIRISLK